MASYNNYFPQSYANTMYGYANGAVPTQAPAPAPMQTQLGTINWVQGEAGARSVPVPAGQKALLMDSETNIFYIKSSDASGMPLPLRTFEYKEVGVSAPASDESMASPQSTYVTHEELEKILAELKQSKQKEEKSNEFII